MRGSIARIAVIVAAVVVGIVVLGNAFPGAGDIPNAQGTVTPSPTGTKGGKQGDGDKKSSKENRGNKKSKPRCKRQGVEVAVYNASGIDHMAHAVAEKLRAAGYVVKPEWELNADHSRETLVFYRTAKDKAEAKCVAEDFFAGTPTRIEKLLGGTDVPAPAELAVYIGVLYGEEHPIG